MSTAYITWAEIQLTLPDIKATQQVLAESMALRGARRLERKIGVPEGFFDVAPEDPTPRVFYGTGKPYLLLDPFVYDEDTFVVSAEPGVYLSFSVVQDHFLFTADAGGVLTPSSYWMPRTAYTVTARWGFAATPGDVKEAALQMFAWMWDSRAKPYKGLVNGRFNPDTQYDAGMPRELRDSISDTRDWCIRQGWILP